LTGGGEFSTFVRVGGKGKERKLERTGSGISALDELYRERSEKLGEVGEGEERTPVPLSTTRGTSDSAILARSFGKADEVRL
jgi:hypothetical protein